MTAEIDTLAGVQILGADATLFDIGFANGVITAIAPAIATPARRLLAMPALANAHDHCRPLSPTSFGGAGKPLETWLLRLAAMPSVDPYLAACAAFGRAARSGVASVMAHYTRPQGPMPFVDEAREIARAAADVGVRATLAIAMRDRNPLVYGDAAVVRAELPPEARAVVEKEFFAPTLSATEQVARVEAVAAAVESETFAVQFGPTGVQWCSDELLRNIARASARSGRRIHMHLLETKYQRAFADRAYPDGLLPHLKSLGFISDRVAFAHCVYARPDELALIAEAGATIVTNPSSNLHLASGIAPIGAAIKKGVRIACGVDGSALDEDDDALREMRLGYFLQGGWGFDKVIERAPYLEATVANGRRANGAPGSGDIKVGEPADLLVLDLDRLDRDAVMPVDPIDLVFARANQAHVAHLVVAGKVIVRDGKLLGVELDQIHAQLRGETRRAMPGRAGFLAASGELERGAADFYRGLVGCC
jgi:cytosine/adenosine deaminase-related metal-dependent hydrolase